MTRAAAQDGADKLVLKSGIIVEKDSEGNKTQTMTDGLKKIDKTDGTKIMHLPGGMIIEDYVVHLPANSDTCTGQRVTERGRARES